MKAFKLALAGALLFAGPASAADIVGTWLRSNGESRVRMTKCGGGVCGVITWLKNPAKTEAKVGQQVFYDMKEDGGVWTGTAFNPEDGRTYTGKASISGPNMTTKGCVFGGLICKTVTWTRVN